MKKLFVLSLLTICSFQDSLAQSEQVSVSTMVPLVNGLEIQIPSPPNNVKPINTPAATDGANYDGEVQSTLEKYNNRKKLIRMRAEAFKTEQKRIAMEQYQRQLYEESLKKAAKKQSKESNGSSSDKKSMSIQDYYSRNSRIFAGQKE